MYPSFSIAEAFQFGWRKTRAHSGVLFQGMLALFAVEILSSIVEKVLGRTVEGILASVLLAIVGAILGAGFTLITLKLARGTHATYRDLIPEASVVWPFLLASALAGLIILGGLILLIIPGLYFLARFAMVRFAVLDGASVRESLKRSSALTEGVRGRILLFVLAAIGLNIVGAIFFLVGLLVTVPVTAIAHAHVYLKLKNRAPHATFEHTSG